MKKYYFLLAILFVQVSYSQTTSKEDIYERFNGHYTIEVFVPTQTKDWKKIGSGSAEFSHFFDKTYIREIVKTNMNGKEMNMDNTIGIDGRTGKFRLIACDKEWSTMDVYNGELENNKLIFDNLKSDIKTYGRNKKEISFRLTYTFLSKSKNELLVEITADKGKTWMPYVKQVQTKVRK